MLTSRQRALLRNFLENNQPIHIKDLADTFNLSVRTIKYDLEAIRKWLSKVKMVLYSSPKKGVWLESNPSKRNRLYRLLEENDNPESSVYDQNERSRIIMLDLLAETQFINISYWEHKLKVSRQTIQSDLSMVEPLLKEWGLKLSRGRKGIHLLGTENQKRLGLEHILQNAFDPHEMFQLLKAISQGRTETNLLNRYGHLLRLHVDFICIYQTIAHFIRLTNEQLGISLSDRVVIGLLIRVPIALQRVSKGFIIESDSYKDKSIESNKIFILFKKVMEELSRSVDLNLPEHEIVYASLPLIGKSLIALDGYRDIDPYKLAKNLVIDLTESSQIPFHQDPELINLLFNHLSDKLKKIQQGIVEPNPFINDIARHYNQLFKMVENSYLKYINSEGIAFTESDIGYLVLHFQASIERLKNSQKYKALVVCGTGRGMARLLKNKLERDMKELIVAGTCSVLEIEKTVEFLDVDIVISMLPVECTIPVIQVNVIPTDKDLQDIKHLLEELPQKTGSKPKLNSEEHVQSNLEALTQDIIMKGLEIAKFITTHFERYLPSNRSEGLFQHLLFMVNRLAFNNAYHSAETRTRLVGQVEFGIRQELTKMFSEREINLSEEELDAIMAYFIWEEKGESDVNVGS
ncbi:transcription antiterminator [Pullulanibacillus sp. KACC 23026]|uniref:BglG family transcription antiterminator n=1 Tax=Pullulanibacillus sp. KACC 23026 TaxID=3028315 RepID=UPI0023B1F85D|nr:transcription antiterminator [Pullulanibacillus sp. KACC 23026]WEG11218.1 transcription antiterminator [Pullulanibacillus sp. KACC 23026]